MGYAGTSAQQSLTNWPWTILPVKPPMPGYQKMLIGLVAVVILMGLVGAVAALGSSNDSPASASGVTDELPSSPQSLDVPDWARAACLMAHNPGDVAATLDGPSTKSPYPHGSCRLDYGQIVIEWAKFSSDRERDATLINGYPSCWASRHDSDGEWYVNTFKIDKSPYAGEPTQLLDPLRRYGFQLHGTWCP